MQINLRNIFSRMQLTQQDIQTLSGVIMAIAEGRKGSARGGILDSEEAGKLRALLAEHGSAESRDADAPVRGLAKFLRRNPTDAERALWDGLTKDRRFAGLFKRQTPVGPHINDFVSFQQRLVIDVVPDNESEAAAKARAEKHEWLKERDYRVVSIRQVDLERDLTGVLDSLAAALGRPL
jgi:tRNA/rRNA methyltransferase